MHKPAAGLIGLAGSLALVVSGLVASAMLVVDYLRPLPVFCVEGGGCDALKHTAYAMPLHVPMPVLGVLGFAVLAVASLWPGERARVVQLGVSAVGAVAGLLLISIKFRLGHICPYCIVADVSGILSLTAAGWRLKYAADVRAPQGWIVAGGAVAALSAAVPMVTGFRLNITPKIIRDELALTPRGDVTVVDFVDYECPFCRMTHAELAPVLESHRDRIRLVRRQVPLHSHVHAMDAARAACCGDKLGQGEAMANALFTAEVDDLTPDGCEKIAQSLGVPVDAYRACVANPATDASIEADRNEFKAAGGYALPTIWIDETQLVGAQPHEVLAKTLHEAIARAGS
jgi:uncharacterized membrane protein/predicted DsbA family dithiol-disulfide isomerase